MSKFVSTDGKFNHGRWLKEFKGGNIEEAPLDRKGQMIKGFQPGDMWRNDFDYIGMLKYGASIEIPEDPNQLLAMIDTLNALFNSFEDVNYHRESQDLGNAIDYIEDSKGVEDLERAQDFLEMFKKKCMSTLDVMKVKWTPGR